jgi:hypothetical protein
VNRELAEHVSLIAAPILAALIVRAPPTQMIGDPEWQKQARSVAINLAHDLWLATLDTE